MSRLAERVVRAERLSGGTAELLDPALSMLRWIIIGTMLLITLVWPLPARTGAPIWLFVVVFAGYNALIEGVRATVPRLSSFAWVPLVDLPMAALLYALDAEPGGPLFVSFYLAVVVAAASWPVPRTLLYTAVAVVLIVAIAPTLPLWEPSASTYREFAARMVILCLLSGGTAFLSRRLAAGYQARLALHDRATRSENLNQLRAEFVSAVSHDLRTPLTAARAGLGLLETSTAGRLATPEGDLLDNVRRNIERLNILIDDLITLNQLEHGMLTMERAPLDLRASVTAAISAVRPLLDQREQRVVVDLPTPLPVTGDARQLEHVIINLVANAHQHTPPGTVITLAGYVNGNQVILRVGDSGPGIRQDELERIFEQFHRAASIGTGSGLGLAIAKRVVELHGGRIWAESEPGTGATFQVRLPMTCADGRENSE